MLLNKTKLTNSVSWHISNQSLEFSINTSFACQPRTVAHSPYSHWTREYCFNHWPCWYNLLGNSVRIVPFIALRGRPRLFSLVACSNLKFIGPKVWSIPDDIKFSTTFTFKWKLKKHFLHENNSQLWTLATFHLFRTKLLCILVFCNSVYFLCVFTFSCFLCAHSMLFGMKVHFLVFSVLLCFSFVPNWLVFVTFSLVLFLIFLYC